MMKWVGTILSLLLVALWIILSSPFNPFKPDLSQTEGKESPRIVFAQDQRENKKGETDTYYIQVLVKLKEKLDEWLKSLNERIESEDVTRFEVRFLEILRNILEWIKEKVEAKIESSRGIPTEKREKKGLFRESLLTTLLKT